MKKLAFFGFSIAILLLSSNLFAQSQKYIEVTSLDTILLKPISFSYTITPGPSNKYFSYSSDDTSKIASDSITEEVIKILKEKRFQFKISNYGDYSLTVPNSAATITVTIKSESELNRLYKEIKELKPLEGRISDIKYESEEPYKEASFKKLYERALTQAKQIAACSNNSIGQLISVSEYKSEQNNMLDFYKQISKMIPYMPNGNTPDTPNKLEKEFTFKFEMK